MSNLCQLRGCGARFILVCFQQGCGSLTFGRPEATAHKHEFVPFLVNFLREQSSQALAHGPATPAKTPRPPAQSHGFTDRRTCRAAGGGVGTRSSSRVQLFSPAASSVSPGTEFDASGQNGSHSLSGVNAFDSPSFAAAWSPASRSAGSERRSGQRISLGDYIVSPPDLQPNPSLPLQKGRRRSAGNVPMGGPGRHGGGRGGHHSDENGGRRSGRGGGGYSRISEQVSPPSVGQLNLSNLEDFPPVGSSPISSA